MRKLITAAVFATIVASPAFAQSYDPDLGSGNIAPSDYVQAAPRTAHRAIAIPPSLASIAVWSSRMGPSPAIPIRISSFS